MPIIFALCCLVLAAVNDLVFKFYARKKRSRGWYVMIIGLIWTSIFIVTLSFDFSQWPQTLLWGLCSGILSVAANILLIEAMSHQDAGVCSMIYRLNLVAVAIGAFLLLNESFTLMKISGLLLAVVAIILFSWPAKNALKTDNRLRNWGIFIAVIAALLRAGMGLSYKYAFLNGADYSGVITLNSLCWIIGGMTYALIREPKLTIMNKKCWSYGCISGVLISGIVLFMALALRGSDASIVLPISQMSFLLTFVLSIFFFKESYSLRKIIGMFAGILCIIALTCG